MDKKLLDKTLLFIKEIFKNDSSGHDFYHSLRVYNIATAICKEEKADLEVVQLASLLHDIDDYKLFGGKIGSCERAKEFLQNNNISPKEINDICEIISSISFKGKDTQVPKSIEGKIVQDADRIDAIGAIGIARVFAYGGSINRAIYIPEEKPFEDMNEEQYYSHKGTSINHFYEKLLKLKGLMNTETAKKLADSRDKYMQGFLKEFFLEWEGEM